MEDDKREQRAGDASWDMAKRFKEKRLRHILYVRVFAALVTEGEFGFDTIPVPFPVATGFGFNTKISSIVYGYFVTRRKTWILGQPGKKKQKNICLSNQCYIKT